MTRLLLSLSVIAATVACTADDEDASGSSTSAQSTGDDGSTGSAAGSTESSPATSSPSTSTDSTTGGATTQTEGETTATSDSTATTTGSASESSGDDTTGSEVDVPPTGEAALLPWLEAGSYEDWPAEAEPHPSAGPHFTAVRTFVNTTLLESLEAGNTEHPIGATAVKELYGANPEIGGWAVMIKVASGDDASTWYWYESFGDTTYADDTGVAGCGNCHASGADYVRTSLPL